MYQSGLQSLLETLNTTQISVKGKLIEILSYLKNKLNADRN